MKEAQMRINREAHRQTDKRQRTTQDIYRFEHTAPRSSGGENTHRERQEEKVREKKEGQEQRNGPCDKPERKTKFRMLPSSSYRLKEYPEEAKG
jgi:hypothetical protein